MTAVLSALVGVVFVVAWFGGCALAALLLMRAADRITQAHENGKRRVQRYTRAVDGSMRRHPAGRAQ